MSTLTLDYATPSAFDADRSRASLALTANRRRPVRFQGRVRQHIPSLRFALRALGEAIWSNEGRPVDEPARVLLDPVITVHPDRLIFEAFSQDQSSFVRLDVDAGLFDVQGPVAYGTSNVDFTAWLWGALDALRSSRETELRIDTTGLEVPTSGSGRLEAKVELPDSWLRGMLQVQAAMCLPDTRLALRPVDLLAALRFLRYANAKVSPRALRYEMEPDQDARLVLEPWEQIIPLHGAQHGYTQPHSIRTWGRHRLTLLEPLLPFADRVRVHLKRRWLPSFYAVDLPGMTFLLGLSGFAGNRSSSNIALDLTSAAHTLPSDGLASCLQLLASRVKLDAEQAAAELAMERPHATLLLERLVRQGRAMFDLETREYRHRELFETPVDEAALYPRDGTLERAAAYVESRQVQVAQCEPEETRTTRRFKTEHGRVEREVIYRDWRATAAVADQPTVTVVLDHNGQVVFGECGCDFFRENLLNRGPCAHMLALYQTVSECVTDLPSSQPADHPPERPFRDPRTGRQTYGARWGDADVDKDDDGSDKAV